MENPVKIDESPKFSNFTNTSIDTEYVFDNNKGKIGNDHQNNKKNSDNELKNENTKTDKDGDKNEDKNEDENRNKDKNKWKKIDN